MTDKRDLRDPQKLGEKYQELRQKGLDIETAVQMPAEVFDADHQGPVEKYGRPQDIEPRWQEIQVA